MKQGSSYFTCLQRNSRSCVVTSSMTVFCLSVVNKTVTRQAVMVRPCDRIDACCLAVAGPVRDNRVTFTNRGWVRVIT